MDSFIYKPFDWPRLNLIRILKMIEQLLPNEYYNYIYIASRDIDRYGTVKIAVLPSLALLQHFYNIHTIDRCISGLGFNALVLPHARRPCRKVTLENLSGRRYLPYRYFKTESRLDHSKFETQYHCLTACRCGSYVLGLVDTGHSHGKGGACGAVDVDQARAGLSDLTLENLALNKLCGGPWKYILSSVSGSSSTHQSGLGNQGGMMFFAKLLIFSMASCSYQCEIDD